MDLILASTSPYRKQLLQQEGITFRAMTPLFDEDSFKSDKYSPEVLCELLAEKKALSLAKQFPNAVIIGSDQMLVFNKKMFNKPKSKNEVIQRLLSLQGQTHSLLTSLFVYSPKKNFTHLDKTELTMKSLNQDEIIDYYNKDQPLGCAGGYKYELNGQYLFENVKSQDLNSIIGLPILALKDIINKIKGDS